MHKEKSNERNHAYSDNRGLNLDLLDKLQTKAQKLSKFKDFGNSKKSKVFLISNVHLFLVSSYKRIHFSLKKCRWNHCNNIKK